MAPIAVCPRDVYSLAIGSFVAIAMLCMQFLITLATAQGEDEEDMELKPYCLDGYSSVFFWIGAASWVVTCWKILIDADKERKDKVERCAHVLAFEMLIYIVSVGVSFFYKPTTSSVISTIIPIWPIASMFVLFIVYNDNPLFIVHDENGEAKVDYPNKFVKAMIHIGAAIVLGCLSPVADYLFDSCAWGLLICQLSCSWVLCFESPTKERIIRGMCFAATLFVVWIIREIFAALLQTAGDYDCRGSCDIACLKNMEQFEIGFLSNLNSVFGLLLLIGYDTYVDGAFTTFC